MKKFISLVLILVAFAAQAVVVSIKDDNIEQQQAEQDAEALLEIKEEFRDWLFDDFREEALRAGVLASTFDEVMANIEYMEDVIKKDRFQGEFVKHFNVYYNRSITPDRIKEGRQKLAKYRKLLSSIEKNYGIPSSVLMAFWGMETSFGRNFGKFNILHSLATLAFDERRREFFKKELILALNLIQTQKLVSNIMLGSWAGAMGNFQFMPSTLTNNAVDGDGDGVVDIWKSLPDAFASAAHYLKDSGWKNTGRWGEEVLLPSDFDYSYALDYKEKKPLSLWRKLGVKRTTQKLVANSNTKMASLFAPIGKKGPAFLLYDNFHVIMRWNASTAYALGVGILSDRITGRPKLKVGFKETKMLSFHEIKEVQEYLKKNDYYKGEVDGLVGPKMKIATYNYQKDNNLKVVDGYPDIDMYFAIFKEWHISNEEYKFEKKLKIVDDRAFEIERKSTSNLNTLVE